MTQEDKELVLKDLSARLPYGVIVRYYHVLTRTMAHEADGKLISDMLLDDDRRNYLDALGHGYYKLPKPYLRPMSSMTEEEKKELSDITGGKFTYVYGILSNSYQNKDDGEWHNKCFRYVTLESIILVIDWLNKHHFDYRGLIEKGLALEAPEGIYK